MFAQVAASHGRDCWRIPSLVPTLPTGLQELLHKSYTGYAREGGPLLRCWVAKPTWSFEDTARPRAFLHPREPESRRQCAVRLALVKHVGRLVLLGDEGTSRRGNDDQARLPQKDTRPPGSADTDAELLRDLAHAGDLLAGQPLAALDALAQGRWTQPRGRVRVLNCCFPSIAPILRRPL
jgi:hypothetical protein